MAIKNPFTTRKANKTTTADTAPDWRKHPDILAHRAKLEGARSLLPTLAGTLAAMERKYQDAEETYARCEMHSAAGKPLPDGYATLEDAKKALEQARTQYLIARVAHADAVKAHADLEASAQDIEETARAEVARQMSDEYMTLLDAQAATLASAVEAQAAVQAYRAKLQAAFPGFLSGDTAFHRELGLESWPLNDLRTPTPELSSTAYSKWLERYAQIRAERARTVQPIPPERR